jgi:hypothetical protein
MRFAKEAGFAAELNPITRVNARDPVAGAAGGFAPKTATFGCRGNIRGNR